MAFDWAEYLELARCLEQGRRASHMEAAYRCAVSRAYYAAYGTAFRYSLSQGYAAYGTGQDHSGVRRFLASRGMGAEARRLKRLSQWREHCDYHDSVPGSLQFMVAAAIRDAERVLAAIP